MTNFLLRSLPPQSVSLYSLLSKKNPMTAKDISREMCILPHAVYRAVKPLKEIGLVIALDTYPTSYSARPLSDAIDKYTFTIRQNFNDAFGKQTKRKKEENLNIAFIYNRADLLEKTNSDILKAKKTVHFMVSGLEVPSETILAYKKAIEQGVTVRAIVHNLDETTQQMFRNWKKIGVEIKHHPIMESRVFIIDEQIVYFTSYTPERREESIGIRFNHMPHAKMMNEVFSQRWNKAQEV